MRMRLEWPLLRFWCREQGECAWVAFKLRGPELSVEFPSDWHEYKRVWFHIGLALFSVNFSLPWYGKVPVDDGQCSGPKYGFAFHDVMLWIYTGKSTSSHMAWITVSLPWAYKHYRHAWLRYDGSVYRDVGDHEYQPPVEISTWYPYTYLRLNRELQHRQARVNGEEREYRLHYATWLPWPRKVYRTISVQFSDEVGERTGSWKGGTTGCSWAWKRGETQEEALRRMERLRTF